MKKLALMTACAATMVLSGCASILNEKTQQINVSASNGKEITGTIDGQEFKGPGIVNVTRENKNKVLVAKTEGCAKETVMEKSVDSKFWINILTGGVWGSTTDYSSDKMWRYSESIVVSCK
jgi:outer membrane murein-binding lipoprotein Lpp